MTRKDRFLSGDGQRSHSVLQQVFTLKWDTESWYGEGYPATVA